MWAGITGVIIGILLGGTAAWLWLNSRSGGANSVATLKRENERFREEVNEHFVQTAELINQLTDSYKAVFDHLSEGAEKLVDQEAVRERMPQVTDEVVRLKRLGAPLDRPEPAEPTEHADVPESEPERSSSAQDEVDASDEQAKLTPEEVEGPHQPR